MPEVIVRGFGLTSALGQGARTNAEALLACQTGVCLHPDLPWVPPNIPIALVRQPGPQTRSPGDGLELLAGPIQEALAMAGMSQVELSRSGIFYGTTSGFYQTDDIRVWESHKADPNATNAMLSRGFGWVGSEIGRMVGRKGTGPVINFSAACISSAAALVEAIKWVAMGKVEHAIVVGYETVLRATACGFRTMLLTDLSGPKPFDRRRAGTSAGEGCAALVLSSSGRGQRLLGGRTLLDPTSATNHHPEGLIGQRMIAQLFDDCGIGPGKVTAIKAHGTGTVDNDYHEAKVLNGIFGQRLPPLSALKGAMGHCMGAAGLMEVAAWLACLDEGLLPPAHGFTEPDPQLQVAPLQTPMPAPEGVHLMQYYGFGGAGAAIALDYRKVAK